MIARASEIEELAARLREAVREELRVAARGLPFRAWDVSRSEGHLYMSLEREGRISILDESQEEVRLAWDGQGPGSAEIISIIPAVSVVKAFLTSGRPPAN